MATSASAGLSPFILCCLVFERYVRISDDPTGKRIVITFAVLLVVQRSACSLFRGRRSNRPPARP